MGVAAAHFVGNSMGAINLLTDATSENPVLPVRSLTLICGGGEIQRSEHTDALFEYDASVEAMRRIVTALFFDPAYPADEEYVRRRHESSTAPGAGDRRGPLPQARADIAADPVHHARLRAHHRSDVGDRGGRRQAAAVWVGRRHRGPDLPRPLGRGRRGRTLPPDRTTGRRQRTASQLPRKVFSVMTYKREAERDRDMIYKREAERDRA
jgi:hypothetical protein